MAMIFLNDKFGNRKSSSEARRELIDVLEKNNWSKRIEYDWDEDKSVPVDYSWEVRTKKGFRLVIFGTEDNPNDFAFIKIEDYETAYDKDPLIISESKFYCNTVSEIYIENEQVMITVGANYVSYK